MATRRPATPTVSVQDWKTRQSHCHWTSVQVANALDSIKVVPNPYYGFSQYETSQFTNTVKITNLPGEVYGNYLFARR
jgi:hypothetical protein